jgi:hypothetical protein
MLRFLKHKASFIPIKKKKNVQGSFDYVSMYMTGYLSRNQMINSYNLRLEGFIGKFSACLD